MGQDHQAPKDGELQPRSRLYHEDLRQGGCSINVNNHYEGSAPLTIERLEALLPA